MSTNINIGNAFVHLYDTFNSDDDESANELAIIEAHIKQFEAEDKANAKAEAAMYLHYFAEEVIKQLPETCGDLFGVGEDCFVMDLFPFAELILSVTNKAHDQGLEFSGVFVYEAMEELAGLWIATVMRQTITVCAAMAYEMPELDEFELDVVRVVASHTQ